jgi:hypothetical protein
MNPIPDDWIDKLFVCMQEFYGQRWEALFHRKNDQNFYKTMWKNGLAGLEYDQIKDALKLYKQYAKDEHSKAPYVTDFYQTAKGFVKPVYKSHNNDHIYSSEIRENAMREIREKLA